jgi:hypothetical protein
MKKLSLSLDEAYKGMKILTPLALAEEEKKEDLKGSGSASASAIANLSSPISTRED